MDAIKRRLERLDRCLAAVETAGLDELARKEFWGLVQDVVEGLAFIDTNEGPAAEELIGQTIGPLTNKVERFLADYKEGKGNDSGK